MNESFDGYVILEDKLKSVDLASLLSYKYTLPSSSLSDNTPETQQKTEVETEEKPKRTIIKPETNKEDNMTDKQLTDYWCYVTNIMNKGKRTF